MAKLPESDALGRLHEVMGGSSPEDDEEYGPMRPGKCNAKLGNVDGNKRRCGQSAGHGTSHPGYGPCRHHFGATRAFNNLATRARYETEFAGRVRFGDILEIDPDTGILQEIGRTSGFISFLEHKITQSGIDTDSGEPDLTVSTDRGPDVDPLVRLWQIERAHFARCCKMAADMGVAQAQLNLAQAMGATLAGLVESILIDLGHDPHEAKIEQVVTTRLALVGR